MHETSGLQSWTKWREERSHHPFVGIFFLRESESILLARAIYCRPRLLSVTRPLLSHLKSSLLLHCQEGCKILLLPILVLSPVSSPFVLCSLFLGTMLLTRIHCSDCWGHRGVRGQCPFSTIANQSRISAAVLPLTGFITVPREYARKLRGRHTWRCGRHWERYLSMTLPCRDA